MRRFDYSRIQLNHTLKGDRKLLRVDECPSLSNLSLSRIVVKCAKKSDLSEIMLSHLQNVHTDKMHHHFSIDRSKYLKITTFSTAF